MHLYMYNVVFIYSCFCDFNVHTMQQDYWLHLCRVAVAKSPQDDDVSAVLKGVSSASLEALNYVDSLNKKYEAFTIWTGFLLGFSLKF